MKIQFGAVYKCRNGQHARIGFVGEQQGYGLVQDAYGEWWGDMWSLAGVHRRNEEGINDLDLVEVVHVPGT